MTALAFALAFLGALAFSAFVLDLREKRLVRAEARLDVVSSEDFHQLARLVGTLKADVEKLQAAAAFGLRR